jgi:hypothetical protein
MLPDDTSWFFGIQESDLPGKLVIRTGVAYRNEYDEDIPTYILPSIRRLHRLLEDEYVRHICLEQLHLLANGM